MATIDFLVSTLFTLITLLFLLRLWLQLVSADYYNPISQFVVKVTHPLVRPLRRALPSIGRLDTASLVLALVAIWLGVVVRLLIAGGGTQPVVALLLTPQLLVSACLDLLFYVLIGRVILSWVSQGHNPMERLLGQMTEPLLAPIRRIVPPVGGLDLSVMALMFIIYLLRYYLLPDLLGVRL